MHWCMNIKLICWLPLVIEPGLELFMQADTTIQAMLGAATQRLAPTSPSSRLDAEILLAHTLEVSRSYLLAWPERQLTLAQQKAFDDYLKRRAAGEPLAYILGQREFWSLNLNVTPATLIPRPETELLIDLILRILPATAQRIADLGTGAGPLALAMASTRPLWQIDATDNSEAVLDVARANANRLQLHNVNFHLGFWFAALPAIQFDAILSNPPYIALGDAELAEEVARFEPSSALIADENGLADLRHIIEHALGYLKSEGVLILEHGHLQSTRVRELMKSAGFERIASATDVAGIERATFGYKPIEK
jgi:release factor glutamine methyltransferase